MFCVLVVIPHLVRVPIVLDTKPMRANDVALGPQDSFEDAVSKRMLDTHYINAPDIVPVDYPYKRIGECPFSKAQSTDMPIPDIPICVLIAKHVMTLI